MPKLIRTKNVKDKHVGVTKAELRQALRSFESRTRELKYTNPIYTGSFSPSGAILALTQSITQNDTAQTRDGNSINVVELNVNFQAQLNTSANFDWVRCVIFIDRMVEGNSNYPTVSELLMSAVSGSPFEKYVFITKRYKILMNLIMSLSSAGDSKVTQHNQTIKLNNHHVEFLATTSVSAANGPGSIFALVLGDAGSNFSAYSLNVAVKFFDS